MTQTISITEYDPAILARATRAVRRELDESAKMDGHRRHSVVSLALQLGVAPYIVHDVALTREGALIEQAHIDLDGQVTGEQAAEIRGDAERDTWGVGRRWGGGYELPAASLQGADDGIGDTYLPVDTVAYVLDHVHAPIVTGAPAAEGIGAR